MEKELKDRPGGPYLRGRGRKVITRLAKKEGRGDGLVGKVQARRAPSDVVVRIHHPKVLTESLQELAWGALGKGRNGTDLASTDSRELPSDLHTHATTLMPLSSHKHMHNNK